MEVANSPNSENPPVAHHAGGDRRRSSLYHEKFYFALLIFVLIAGLPVVAIPSLRSQLRSRVETLRDAAMGEPMRQPPAKAIVGENHEPFPKVYEHTQAPVSRTLGLKIDAPQPRSNYRIAVGGEEPPARAAEATAATPKGKPAIPSTPVPQAGAAATETPPAGAAGSDSRYRKGKSEQEAYDMLLSANPTLAGMVKGSDPALKFQDWAAADMGQDSYYVMVTFVQALDNIPRKYIWNVKLATKEIVPLSAYAREISK